MENLQIDKKTRDEIVRFLKGQIVPAEIGAGLIQVANILNALQPVTLPESKKVAEQIVKKNDKK
jgi:hypothetical protein